MATIDQRPNGKWRAQIRRAGHRPLSKTLRKKSDVEAWARRVEADLDRGVAVEASALQRISVSELLQRFRDEVSPHRKGCAREQAFIDVLLRDAEWCERRLNQDVAGALRLWVQDRLRTVQASTVNRELALVASVFTHAIKDWSIPLQINPVSQIKRPSISEKRRERIWTEADVACLRAAVDVLRQGVQRVGKRREVIDYVLPAVELGCETAMRLGEIWRISVAATDIEHATTRLDDTKNGDSRVVPLSTRALEILRPLLDEATAAGRDEVFPVLPQSLGVEFRKLRAKTPGLAGLRLHDTRHSGVTKLASKLSNVLELGAVSGHRDPRSLRRYYHPDMADVAKRLG